MDADESIWLVGRLDDVMNVSGRRISSAEVKSALLGYRGVVDVAVVGAADESTGQRICAFVVVEPNPFNGTEMIEALSMRVTTKIGKIARPSAIYLVPDLPKTRSGKIRRRLLRDAAAGRSLGDTSTLLNPKVFDEIRAGD